MTRCGPATSTWSTDSPKVGREATFYTRLGVNWSADNGRGAAGFNFTYGMDWFPVRPVVVSGTIDWGRLGDASLFHGRASIGLLLNRFEVFTGYDHYNLEGAPLNGLVNGLRIWF